VALFIGFVVVGPGIVLWAVCSLSLVPLRGEGEQSGACSETKINRAVEERRDASCTFQSWAHG
jgi:hypothetical protein